MRNIMKDFFNLFSDFSTSPSESIHSDNSLFDDSMSLLNNDPGGLGLDLHSRMSDDFPSPSHETIFDDSHRWINPASGLPMSESGTTGGFDIGGNLFGTNSSSDFNSW
ncbi:MAG: hypothetical protein M3Q07_19905 [Pseudobdellovibrionaceae bacterium]|nr:hypothetical protein [Pseudobdellovibrionaceae bacterium]